MKKNDHNLMRHRHPDRHPSVDRHISQQLVGTHNNLIDPATWKINDCFGVHAVMRKDSSHFCRPVTPGPFYEPLDDLWN